MTSSTPTAAAPESLLAPAVQVTQTEITQEIKDVHADGAPPRGRG